VILLLVAKLSFLGAYPAVVIFAFAVVVAVLAAAFT